MCCNLLPAVDLLGNGILGKGAAIFLGELGQIRWGYSKLRGDWALPFCVFSVAGGAEGFIELYTLLSVFRANRPLHDQKKAEGGCEKP